MRRLKLFPRRVVRGERGAVAAIFAILLAGGVVMGMLALTVDVGSIMFERRQLQNAADSTSMALAMNCAKDTTKCTPALNKPEMISLAGLNAADGLAQLAVRADAPDGMCGRNTGNLNMPLCASSATNAPIANLAECPPLPSSLTSGQGALTAYVETYSLTKSTATNNTILPSIFSRALTGAFTGKSHTACARAAYGPVAPTSDIVLALTMSECDWTSQTGYTGPGTATYPTGPSGAWPGYDLTTRPWPAIERGNLLQGQPDHVQHIQRGRHGTGWLRLARSERQLELQGHCPGQRVDRTVTPATTAATGPT